VAPGRTEPRGRRPRVSALVVAMRDRLKEAANRKLYGMRQSSVEPVLGQIKQIREKVRSEWQLICLTHNLLKLFRHQTA